MTPKSRRRQRLSHITAFGIYYLTYPVGMKAACPQAANQLRNPLMQIVTCKTSVDA